MVDANDTAVPATVYADLGCDTVDRMNGPVPVAGSLPEGLEGVLYRNGPGRFRRAGRTKNSLLDGDGVIQRLEIRAGAAHYARRFVRTPKFVAEEAAGRFIHPTWTTRAPGWGRNLLSRGIRSQAGATVLNVNGVLQAFDEVAPGFAIDPASLETRGAVSVGLPQHDAGIKAHARRIAATGDWVFLSTRMGAHMDLDFLRVRRDGTRIPTPTIRSPRRVYVHDFAVTERFAVVILQPAFFRALPFLAGVASFTEALQWRADTGNLVLVVDLASGAVTRFEAPAAWHWHFANAWEQGGDVVVDFVGFDDPGHFLGAGAQLASILHGRAGERGAPGTLRRYVLHRASGRLQEAVLLPRNCEFPSVDGAWGGTRHRRVYLTVGHAAGALHSGVAAFDTERDVLDAFDFGAHMHAGEPVFAARPGAAPEQGWLLTETLDTQRHASGFAVFDAERIADGPVARVDLGEPVPLSFHGCWVGT